MGVPKRKAPSGQDGAGPRLGAAKRARSEELTGVRFKAQLRDPKGAEPGECGASRGGEHVRARRVPAAALCQAQPSHVQLFPCTFGWQTGKPRPRRSGLLSPGGRGRCRAARCRYFLTLGCQGRPEAALLGCDSATRLPACRDQAVSPSRP